MMFVLSA